MLKGKQFSVRTQEKGNCWKFFIACNGRSTPYGHVIVEKLCVE